MQYSRRHNLQKPGKVREKKCEGNPKAKTVAGPDRKKDMKNGYTTIILIESERPLSVYITNADAATAFGSADAINFAWPIYLCKAG